MPRREVLYLSLVGLVACGPSNRDGNQPDASSSDAERRTTGHRRSNGSRVYAHSGSKLFRIDTANLATVEIGAMTGLGTQSLTDLAIDKDDHMVGITLDKLYTIDATTGTVDADQGSVAERADLTSLSYVPSDINNPNSADILVSANTRRRVRDRSDRPARRRKIGSYGTVAGGKRRLERRL